ncbi:protein-cysteine N-palmitoyltransferase HHAT isoform X4 [Moschus berezovskii]|uniref:protein-cysteine N-palmitoyltransferase HHAT isoform X4 n=1 Tax=Moschus berezovskii TaxID=68408 RepID=UPI00244500BF|nr:protein-cysteine N-palmitoyltransferase HHAT isoform X4 [Moschus berezovskii]XP_055274996.1 protein-cysteine N-palmitoyltransferase HHAT isoform X4 [Moschus berezovskii]
MLPWWELTFYLLASVGFHFYSFYEVYKVSREYEEELDQEFDLETGTLFGGLKKDPTDFEWSFWMEWGKERLVWLFLGHMSVSQVTNLLSRKHKPWILAVYGMWACRCVLGTQGTATVLIHTTISFCVAQLRSQFLSWLCSLSLLSTLRLQDVEEVKRGWYETESEYYLLQFTLTVRCLYYTSFSLELCWQPPPAQRPFYSLPWMLAYVFYYPVFHNGPVLSFPEFVAQMQQQEQSSPKTSLCILVLGLGRLLFYWWLAELMVHLMYMHAIYSSASLLRAVSSWALGYPTDKPISPIIIAGLHRFPAHRGSASGKDPTCHPRRCKRRGFHPWVGKIPWRRAWQPTPVILPGESMERRAWWATVHSLAKSWTWLTRLSMHAWRPGAGPSALLLREVPGAVRCPGSAHAPGWAHAAAAPALCEHHVQLHGDVEAF